MKTTKMLVITICCALISACATKPAPQPPVDNKQTEAALTAAANSVTQSSSSFAASTQAANPPQDISPAPAPDSYGMQIPISIDWTGAIGPLVKKMAELTDYKLQILGQEPPIPIIVSVHAKNTPVANVLQDAGYQAGKQASIVVFPSTRVIQLRYNNQNNM